MVKKRKRHLCQTKICQFTLCDCPVLRQRPMIVSVAEPSHQLLKLSDYVQVVTKKRSLEYLVGLNAWQKSFLLIRGIELHNRERSVILNCDKKGSITNCGLKLGLLTSILN